MLRFPPCRGHLHGPGRPRPRRPLARPAPRPLGSLGFMPCGWRAALWITDMGEFDLIERFFKQKVAPAPANQARAATNSIVLGIGDDCALLQPAPGTQLAVSTDMLVEGRHFFADVDPSALGHKALEKQVTFFLLFIFAYSNAYRTILSHPGREMSLRH